MASKGFASNIQQVSRYDGLEQRELVELVPSYAYEISTVGTGDISEGAGQTRELDRGLRVTIDI